VSLLETVSGFAVRHLTEEQLFALRSAYYSARNRLSPVMRMVYGTFDSEALGEHLTGKLGKDFEILMVHSSVNHLQPMYTDTALDLVKMLLAFCGPERTLAMPAFYFGDPAIGGAYETFKRRPRFDLRRTPSMMGLATELFRRMDGVVQSRHPIYRISALGPLARPLTAGHERAATASGRGTPFEFMANRDTLIIGLGKPIQVMTQVHHVEPLMGDEFPVPRLPPTRLSMTLIDGKEEIPIELAGEGLAWRFNIWKLRKVMDRDQLNEWSFHHVPMFAARAGEVTRALVEAAKRGVTLYDEP